MGRKLRIQVKENYTRDVFIDVEMESEKINELDELLDKIEGSSASYETLLCDLENQGIKITNCDDNDSLFDFEDNSFIYCTEIKEVEYIDALNEYFKIEYGGSFGAKPDSYGELKIFYDDKDLVLLIRENENIDEYDIMASDYIRFDFIEGIISVLKEVDERDG